MHDYKIAWSISLNALVQNVVSMVQPKNVELNIYLEIFSAFIASYLGEIIIVVEYLLWTGEKNESSLEQQQKKIFWFLCK